VSLVRDGWVIPAEGGERARRFEAPVDIEGWAERPWVRLRPLSAREALRRESLGLREELQTGPDGDVRAVRRSYDLEAMVGYELECCVVDYALPLADADGSVRYTRAADGVGGELLDRLPTRLADWLAKCLDEVNLRRPEDALEPEAAHAGKLREGRDFGPAAELAAIESAEVSADG